MTASTFQVCSRKTCWTMRLPALHATGASVVEVGIRLQKALENLSKFDFEPVAQAAGQHSKWALARNELAMSLPQDIEAVREAARF